MAKKMQEQGGEERSMAVSLVVTNDGPLPVIGHAAPTAPAPAIENVAVSLAATNDGLFK